MIVQKQITKELVKKTYQVLERSKVPQVELLLELFISIIRGKKEASNADVEYYLSKYDGLIVSMNKVDSEGIKGSLAQEYLEKCMELKDKWFNGKDPKTAEYVPFLVWSARVVDMIG